MSMINRARLAGLAIGVVFLAWFFLLRPVALGGPASYLWVTGVSMLPTLETGDFVVTQHEDHYAAGDVVAYHVPAGEPGAGSIVIHRVAGGSGDSGYVMKGDNKRFPDPWHPRDADVVGRLWIAVPGAGTYLQIMRNPTVFAPLAAGVVVFLILLDGPKDKRRRTGAREVPSS
jgi:signal peptidase